MGRLQGKSRKKFKGVQKRKSGKYVSLIWDPFKKRCVWPGTFGSAKEASEMYVSKKQEFEEEIKAKQGSISDDADQHHEESSTSQILEGSTSNSTFDESEETNKDQSIEEEAVGNCEVNSVKEEEEKNNYLEEESEFGVLFGVLLIDMGICWVNIMTYCSIEDDDSLV